MALDFPRGQEALDFLDLFSDPIFVKVGMELFYKEGKEIVRTIKKRGHRVFLDLKLHDIPNTVAGAVASLADLEPDILTIHTTGGAKMVMAARRALEEAGLDTHLMGVTVLTSLSEAELRAELPVSPMTSLEDAVSRLAHTGRSAGLDGVICSAHEVQGLKASFGEDFLTICPGIRPEGVSSGDQSRVVTPAGAREAGADYIVVGRPIRLAQDPLAAYREIEKDFLGGDQ